MINEVNNFYIIYYLITISLLFFVTNYLKNKNSLGTKIQIILLIIILFILDIPILITNNLSLKMKLYVSIIMFTGGFLSFLKYSVYEKIGESRKK
jgi:hypothetical protein